MSEAKYSNGPQLTSGCSRASTMTQIIGTRLAHARRPCHVILPFLGQTEMLFYPFQESEESKK